MKITEIFRLQNCCFLKYGMLELNCNNLYFSRRKMSTLKDIAKIANCSVSTVSRAINNCLDVSEQTRAHVLEIAKKLGYFQAKKHIKTGNRKKNRFNVAVVCPEIESSYYSGILVNIAKEFSKLNARSVIYDYSFDDLELEKILDMCQDEMNIDAIICLGGNTAQARKGNIPIIFADREEGFTSVVFDVSDGINSFFEFAEKNNIKSICFIGESLTIGRNGAFMRVAKDFPSIFSYSYCSPFRFEKAGRDGGKFLLKGELPDAVVCAYDEIALGLIEQLENNGIKVPDNIRVVGINDIPTSKYCFGGLSTISFDIRKCSEMVRDLINGLKNNNYEVRQYIVSSKYIKRNT